MKIKCCLVSQILALSKELPEWARRHIDRCEHCRREADKYARLRSALKSTSADHETCNLSWDQMKSRLLEPDARFAACHRSWTYASAVCLGLILMIGLIVFSIHSRHSQDVRRVAEVTNSAPTVTAPRPVTQPEIVKPNIPEVNEAIKQAPKAEKPQRVEAATVRAVRHHHLPIVKRAKPAVMLSKALDSDVMSAQAEPLQPLPQVPSEISYQAGKLMGQVLIGIAKDAHPALVNKVGGKIKKLLPAES